LLVTLEWIEFGCVHKLYPEELDCAPAVGWPKLAAEPAVRSAITATAELLVVLTTIRQDSFVNSPVLEKAKFLGF